MKKSEWVQIKGLNLKELMIKNSAVKSEIANLVMDKNMKKLKDLKMISKKRKESAQLLTVIKQKQLMNELESKIQSSKPDKEKETKEIKTSKVKKRKEKASL